MAWLCRDSISLLSPMVYQCVILRPFLRTIFLPPLSLLRRQLVCFAVRTTQGFFSILNRFAKFRRKSIQHVINGYFNPFCCSCWLFRVGRFGLLGQIYSRLPIYLAFVVSFDVFVSQLQHFLLAALVNVVGEIVGDVYFSFGAAFFERLFCPALPRSERSDAGSAPALRPMTHVVILPLPVSHAPRWPAI